MTFRPRRLLTQRLVLGIDVSALTAGVLAGALLPGPVTTTVAVASLVRPALSVTRTRGVKVPADG